MWSHLAECSIREFPVIVHVAQFSADNAEEVGAMAEGMAKKVWYFAQSSATPLKGRRSYSTAAAPIVTPGIVVSPSVCVCITVLIQIFEQCEFCDG